MALDNWSDVIPSVIKVPYSAYKHRTKIHYWWKKLQVAIDKGETNIVVVGRPSVGKSVLISHWYGETADLSWELPQTSDNVESKAISIGEWTKIIRVIPGQDIAERYRGLVEAFNVHESLEGVIYLADWGYTNVRDQITKQNMIDEDGIKSIDDLRKYNLENELKDFRDVCKKIEEAHSTGKGPKWLLIVANKVDLYYDKIDKAQKYYHHDLGSAFDQIAQKTIKMVGAQNMACVALPICSWETNFEWNDEIIHTNIGGTDNKRALFKHLIRQISELSNQ